MLGIKWQQAKNDEHRELSARLRHMLRKLSVRQHTLVDFAAEKYLQDIVLENVTERDVEQLFEDLQKSSAVLSSTSKYWFIALVLTCAATFDLSQTFSLQVVEIKDNDLFLAISILVFSALNVLAFSLERSVEMQKRVIRSLLRRRADLDPSRVRRYTIASRDFLAPWTEEVTSDRIFPGWRYFVSLLVLLPVVVALCSIVLLALGIPVWAAYTLYSSSEGSWFELTLLIAAISTTVVRVFGFLVTDKLPIGYKEYQAERNFHFNVEKYGLEGAMYILDDEIEDILSELDAETEDAKKSKPVARVRTGRPGHWTP